MLASCAPDVTLGWVAYLTGQADSTSNRRSVNTRTNVDVQDGAITQGATGKPTAGTATGQGQGATLAVGNSAIVSKPIAFIPNEQQTRNVTAGMISSMDDGLFGRQTAASTALAAAAALVAWPTVGNAASDDGASHRPATNLGNTNRPLKTSSPLPTCGCQSFNTCQPIR